MAKGLLSGKGLQAKDYTLETNQSLEINQSWKESEYAK